MQLLAAAAALLPSRSSTTVLHCYASAMHASLLATTLRRRLSTPEVHCIYASAFHYRKKIESRYNSDHIPFNIFRLLLFIFPVFVLLLRCIPSACHVETIK